MSLSYGLEIGIFSGHLIAVVKATWRVLRANAQKYRAKGGHGQNLTLLCFEFIERY